MRGGQGKVEGAVMDGIKPRALAPKPETIPAELKSYRAWVLWRYELVKEKWTEIRISD